MKANELRIGNYVRCIFSENDYSEITGLTEEHPFINEITADYLDYKDIEPIPLTEEWLLKFNWNGYNPFHFNHNFELDKQGRLYCNGDYKGVNIDYVHQLQNLYFAITWEELTLKPEKKLIKPPESVRTNLILYGNYQNAVSKLEEVIEKYKTVDHPKARLRVERYTEQVRELKEYEPYLNQLP